MWIINLVIKVFILVVFLTFFLNVYERVNNPSEKENFDFVIFLSFIWEIIVDIVFFFLYFVGFYNFDTKIISKEKEFPVVLIPGYTMNRGYFFPYATGLQKRGYNVFVFSPKKLFDSIEDMAGYLQYKINEVLKETGKEKVILVGHSMGGLLSRYYLQRLDGDKHVKKIITIGTPHYGTKLAPFGYGKNAREMEVNSTFISDLNRDIEDFQKNIDFLSIVSKSDNMVIPYQNGHLTGSERYLVDHLGHNSLMFSSEIYGKIVNELEKSEFKAKNE